MAKHFEALQRAEAERKRKAGVGAEPVHSSPAEWEARLEPPSGLMFRLRGMLRRSNGKGTEGRGFGE